MKIPRDCDGAELAKALRKNLGYELIRQTGSHLVLTTQLDGEHHVTIPHHRPLKVGTLQGILRALTEHHDLSIAEVIQRLGL